MPPLLAVIDLLISLGAGMTVKVCSFVQNDFQLAAHFSPLSMFRFFCSAVLFAVLLGGVPPGPDLRGLALPVHSSAGRPGHPARAEAVTWLGTRAVGGVCSRRWHQYDLLSKASWLDEALALLHVVVHSSICLI